MSNVYAILPQSIESLCCHLSLDCRRAYRNLLRCARTLCNSSFQFSVLLEKRNQWYMKFEHMIIWWKVSFLLSVLSCRVIYSFHSCPIIMYIFNFAKSNDIRIVFLLEYITDHAQRLNVQVTSWSFFESEIRNPNHIFS